MSMTKSTTVSTIVQVFSILYVEWGQALKLARIEFAHDIAYPIGKNNVHTTTNPTSIQII